MNIPKPTKAQLKAIPKEPAIGGFFREKIFQGILEPGAALPSMQEIARIWESNYFTVHRALTPLVKEGLLERHKGVGTFVANTQRRLQTVGIYYGTDFISDPRHGYAIQLHRLLHQALKQQGLKAHTWLDPRDLDEAKTDILPEVKLASDTGSIQALIAIMTTSEAAQKLQRLPLPVIQFSKSPTSANVYFSTREFLELSLNHCLENGCGNVGFISSPAIIDTQQRKHSRSKSAVESILQNLCAKAGLTAKKQWLHIVDSGSLSQQNERDEILHAYRSLTDGKARAGVPDAIIVYPDNNLITLQAALAEEQLEFDRKIKIVSHRNEPQAFPMPHGPHYIALSLASVAEGLAQQVVRASQGQPCPSMAAKLIQIEGAESEHARQYT